MKQRTNIVIRFSRRIVTSYLETIKFKFKVKNYKYNQIDKIGDLPYYFTLCKYTTAKKELKLTRKRKVILSSIFELKWSTIIALSSIDTKKVDLLDLIEIYSESKINLKKLSRKSIYEVFALYNFIEKEMERLKAFEEKNFKNAVSSDETRAGIENLSRYSNMILAEDIAQSWNITIDEAYERKYKEVVAKRLKNQDLRDYERALNEIILKKRK